MIDKAKFLQTLSGVHDFYGKEMTEFAAEVWLQACRTFDAEQVSKALSAHLMDSERGQFMPKPADIVRALQGTHTDRALMAWGRVHDAMGRVGAYASVDFGEPAIHAAISDMGGWPAICRSTIDELPFIQKRFSDAYRVYSSRGVAQPLAYLTGESEAANKLEGRPISAPVALGVERVRIAA